MNIEKEIKILLTEEEYNRIGRLFEWDTEIAQTNHYYRCIGKSHYSSVRVRETGGRFYLQVKVPVSEDGALFIKKEYERELDSVPPALSAGELRELTGTELGDAVLMGELFTLRKTAHIENCEICLDRSEYLGITDFELELEYTGEYPQDLVDKMKKLGIDTERRPIGKYARFIQAKGRDNK
jgi:uncharacterized protein YjbK